MCVLVCTINSYFVGQVRALWPGCRHAPQSLVRLAGGSSASVVVVVVVVVVERGVAEGEGAGGGVGDGEREGAGSSSDAVGRGHVTSLKFSGQNSLILLYRYHCR